MVLEPVPGPNCQSIDVYRHGRSAEGKSRYRCLNFGTCPGGGHKQGEVSGAFQGLDFEYSTLGVNAFLQILNEQHCACLHLEYDQYPENCVYIIAQKLDKAIEMDV
jgi:hypothetical protein